MSHAIVMKEPPQRDPVGGREMTLEDVAAELGVSRQYVAEIERKALAKLRATLEARGYTAGDFLDVNNFDIWPRDIAQARASGVLQISRSPITREWTARVPLAGWEFSSRQRHTLLEPARAVLTKHGLVGTR